MYQIVIEAYDNPITDDKGPSVDTNGYKYEYLKRNVDGSDEYNTAAVAGKRAHCSSSQKLGNKRPFYFQSHSHCMSLNEDRMDSLHPQSTPRNVNNSCLKLGSKP